MNLEFINLLSLAKTYNQVAFRGIKEKIYTLLKSEYWLGGGAKIDDPQIRIFSLKDPSP